MGDAWIFARFTEGYQIRGTPAFGIRFDGGESVLTPIVNARSLADAEIIVEGLEREYGFGFPGSCHDALEFYAMAALTMTTEERELAAGADDIASRLPDDARHWLQEVTQAALRIRKEIDRDSKGGTGRRGGTRPLGVVLPRNPERWPDVDIRFRDGESVSLAIGGEHVGVFTYIEMGMVDLRNKTPTKQWELLRNFADERGHLTWDSRHSSSLNQERKETLSKDLRDFFELDEEPFEPSNGGWRAKFTIDRV